MRAELKRFWRWLRRNHYNIAMRLMQLFMLIGFVFAMSTGIHYLVLGHIVMGILWIIWTIIATIVPLYISLVSEEKVHAA